LLRVEILNEHENSSQNQNLSCRDKTHSLGC